MGNLGMTRLFFWINAIRKGYGRRLGSHLKGKGRCRDRRHRRLAEPLRRLRVRPTRGSELEVHSQSELHLAWSVALVVKNTPACGSGYVKRGIVELHVIESIQEQEL